MQDEVADKKVEKVRRWEQAVLFLLPMGLMFFDTSNFDTNDLAIMVARFIIIFLAVAAIVLMLVFRKLPLWIRFFCFLSIAFGYLIIIFQPNIIELLLPWAEQLSPFKNIFDTIIKVLMWTGVAMVGTYFVIFSIGLAHQERVLSKMLKDYNYIYLIIALALPVLMYLAIKPFLGSVF